MSPTLLIVLSVLEAVALIAVLAVFLVLVARRLRSISEMLGKVTFGVRAVERQLGSIGGGVHDLNYALEQLAHDLPALAEKAERLADRR